MNSRDTEKYPFLQSYWFSFHVSVLILSMVIFFTLPEDIFQGETDAVNMDFVELSFIQPQQPKQEKSSEDGEIEKTNQENQNEGDGPPVDLDAQSGVPRPRMLSRLQIKHPPLAVELEVEAKAFLRVLIDKEGNIKSLRIIRILLTKDLPTDIKMRLIEEFRMNILKAFDGKRYSPLLINAKAREADMTQELDINLK